MDKFNEMDIYNTSYNYYLYQARLELNMKKREFAKMLKISYFRYHLIENGYIKPSKKDIEKISLALGINYNHYLRGANSYPKEINDKKLLRITESLYHLFTKKVVKIILGSLTVLAFISLIVSIIMDNIATSKTSALYPEKINEFKTNLQEIGDPNFSLMEYNFPLITEVTNLADGNQKAILVSGSYRENDYYFEFKEIYWTEDYRYVVAFSSVDEDLVSYNVTCVDYQYYSSSFFFVEETKTTSNVFKLIVRDEELEVFKNIKAENITKDIENFVNNKLQLSYQFDLCEFNKTLTTTRDEVSRISTINGIAFIISVILLSLFAFIFGYVLIYQKQKDENYQFSHSDELMGFHSPNVHMKPDIKIFPFIPEVVLRIIGITLVAIGATRMMYYVNSISDYSTANLTSANTYYSIQMLGMFFIFFINFDVFMDDIRLFRNLLLYFIVYILVYVFEASLVDTISNSQTIIGTVVNKIRFPNPFGSATCYFLLMLFLFFTPKIIKTKKRLILFRSMAIIPIAFMITSFCLGHAKELFNVNINSTWITFLFKEDRFPLSILAMSYLVSLFFIRLFFKYKYGEEKATNFFMGNKFLIIKNILATTLIIIIWLIELHYSGDAKLNKIGIGVNTYLIILAPLVLFYHPHKGKRNTALDISLTTVYVLALIFIYTLVVIVAIRTVLYTLINAL